jgi:ankyrin repeat protein
VGTHWNRRKQSDRDTSTNHIFEADFHDAEYADDQVSLAIPVSHATYLLPIINPPITRLSQANISRYIKRWIKESQSETKTASVISYLSVGSLSLNEESTWTKIREELEDLGMDHEAFERNRRFIHEELESAIISGDLDGMYDSGSQDQQSSATSNDMRTSHTSPAQTAVVVIKKATPSHIDLNPRRQVRSVSNKSTFSRLVYRVSHSSYSLADAVERRDFALVRDEIRQGADINCRLRSGRVAWLVAARNGDRDIVKLFLDNGIDILTKKNGFLALQAAAVNGHYEVVQLLLDAGVPHQDESIGINGPLLSAIQEDHEAIVKILLKKGANVNIVDATGQTMLIKATERGHARMVQLLLQHGAEIDHLNNERFTALDLACAACHASIVKLLLSAGANANTSGSSSNTPLHWAAMHNSEYENSVENQLETTKLLLESEAKMAINLINDQRQTPLLYAIRKGKTELVRLLLQNGADIKKRTEAGVRPLLLAVETNDASLVEIILKAASNINEKNRETNDASVTTFVPDRDPTLYEVDSKGESALWKALRLRNRAMVKVLLEKGADPNLVIKCGTMLQEIVQSGDMAMIALLLHYGADPNIISETGGFALIHAVAANKGNIVKFLLDNGADPNLFSKVCQSDTALISAVRCNNYSLVKLLLRRNADIDLHAPESDSALIAACRLGNLQMADVLLEHGAAVNLKRNDGVSALSVITSTELSQNPQSVPIMEILLEKGADPNTKTSLGLPVIFNVVRHGKIAFEIVNLLLAGGADPNSRSDGGDMGTPLLRAIVEICNRRLARLVIESGADLDLGQDGYTSLMHSIEMGDIAILQLLLDKGARLDNWTESEHKFRRYYKDGIQRSQEVDRRLAACAISIKWTTESYIPPPQYDWEKASGKA